MSRGWRCKIPTIFKEENIYFCSDDSISGLDCEADRVPEGHIQKQSGLLHVPRSFKYSMRHSLLSSNSMIDFLTVTCIHTAMSDHCGGIFTRILSSKTSSDWGITNFAGSNSFERMSVATKFITSGFLKGVNNGWLPNQSSWARIWWGKKGPQQWRVSYLSFIHRSKINQHVIVLIGVNCHQSDRVLFPNNQNMVQGRRLLLESIYNNNFRGLIYWCLCRFVTQVLSSTILR